MLVHGPDHLREVGGLEGIADLPGEGLIRPLVPEVADPSADVVIPQVQEAERHERRFPRDLRGDPRFPEEELRPARRLDAEVLALDVVTEDPGAFAEILEEGAHGVVGPDLVQVHRGRLHEIVVQGASVLMFRHVAFCPLEPLQEPGFDGVAEELPGKLYDAAGVLEYLHCFDPRELVEEPPAARVHEHGVPLDLHQLERPGLLFRRQLPGGVSSEKFVDGGVGPVEDHRDVLFPGGPRVPEDLPPFLFEQGGDGVPEPVQRLPQRSPPLLVPSGVTAGIASAVASPAFHAVDAAPGTVLDDPHFVGGREFLQVLSVVGDANLRVRVEKAHRMRKRHLSVGVVVAVRLPVGGDMHQLLRPRALVGECPQQAVGEELPVVE